MKLTGSEARDIVYEDYDSEVWKEATCAETIDNSRWSVIKEQIFLHIPSDTHYRFDWSEGATESQDERAYQYDDSYEPVEVREVKKVMKVWETV